MKIVKKLFVMLFIFISIDGLCDIKFKREEDKGKWIKKVLGGKEVDEFSRYQNEILMRDFINQKNIEYIEPLAEGIDVNDPNVSKYNVACPNDKPINISSEYNKIITICIKNIKIYNTRKSPNEYILYCEVSKKYHPNSNDPYNAIDEGIGVFLSFSTEKCEYSKEIHHGDIGRYIPLDYLFSGLFKYYNEIYFFAIYRDLESNKSHIISIWNEEMSTTSVIY